MKPIYAILLCLPLLACGMSKAGAAQASVKQVIYSNAYGTLSGYLCLPDAAEPRPAVVYNHGGMGEKIGGPPRETCEALAKEGFVGFSPIRRQTVSLKGHLDDVFSGVDYVRGLEAVDPDRIGILGFSRGGLLTFGALVESDEFKAAVIMAAAPGKGQLDSLFSRTERISAPVLLLVSENDNARVDHVQNMKQLESALEANGIPAELIVYPPYGEDGHRMFFEVGTYWNDVIAFLRKYL